MMEIIEPKLYNKISPLFFRNGENTYSTNEPHEIIKPINALISTRQNIQIREVQSYHQTN